MEISPRWRMARRRLLNSGGIMPHAGGGMAKLCAAASAVRRVFFQIWVAQAGA